MDQCKICGAANVGLLQADHKELGAVLVCQPCWVDSYEKNKLVSGTSGCASGCGSCSCCG